jgi:hypothetical protein
MKLPKWLKGIKLIFKKHVAGVQSKLIKSFIAVGDVIEVEEYGELQVYKVEKFEVIMNGYPPTEFVILVQFSYNDGISTIECTSDNFKYVRHISHCM